jgi:hypothetical protein
MNILVLKTYNWSFGDVEVVDNRKEIVTKPKKPKDCYDRKEQGKNKNSHIFLTLTLGQILFIEPILSLQHRVVIFFLCMGRMKHRGYVTNT